MKILRVKRVLTKTKGIASTISLIDSNNPKNNKFLCLGLEEVGVEIHPGLYPLRIRDEGGFHSRYSRKFYFHKGMIEVVVPNRKYILIHIGNSIEDTEGCLLLGESIAVQPHELFLGSSTPAYKEVYKEIIDDVISNNIVLEVL